MLECARKSRISCDNENERPCCESPAIFTDDRGNVICQRCGTVIEQEHVALPPRAFNYLEIKQRATHEMNSKKFMVSLISTLPASFRLSDKRKADWLSLSIRFNARTFIDSRNALNALKSSISLPPVVFETAESIMALISRNKMTRGHSWKEIARVALYFAAKIHGIPIFLMEIGRGHRILKTLHDTKNLVLSRYTFKQIAFEHYIERAATISNMPHEAVARALELYKKFDKEKIKNLGAKNIMVLIAMLFYVSMQKNAILLDDQPVTQKMIATRFNVTDLSIRNHYKFFFNESFRHARNAAVSSVNADEKAKKPKEKKIIAASMYYDFNRCDSDDYYQ